jgi:hypothetical protein
MEYVRMLNVYELGLIIYIALTLFINHRLVKHIRKTDEMISEISVDIAKLRENIRVIDIRQYRDDAHQWKEEEEAYKKKQILGWRDLKKYQKNDKYWEWLTKDKFWEWMNKEEEQ